MGPDGTPEPAWLGRNDRITTRSMERKKRRLLIAGGLIAALSVIGSLDLVFSQLA